MFTQNTQTRWPELVKDLLGKMPRAQIRRRLEVSDKQISRWLSGSHRPSDQNAELLEQFAESKELSVAKYRGLRPIYDFRRTYEENVADGPPATPPYKYSIPSVSKTLIGKKLDSPVGASASVLTADSRWIRRLAEYGFDIITYKTVRTRPRQPNDWPHLVFLPELVTPLTPHPTDGHAATHGFHEPPSLPIADITIANSFGIPSVGPDIWQPDVARSLNCLGPKQVLIVSVVGTRDPAVDLLDDFAHCAKLAHDAGAEAIELNISCPNTYLKEEGDIYRNPDVARELVKRVRQTLPKAKLFLKIGPLCDAEIRNLFQATYRNVDGYSAINSIPLRVVSAGDRNEPVFTGLGRDKPGVSGAAIRHYALQAVEMLHRLRVAKRPDLEILGMGGISTADHARALLDRGADAVLFATSAILNLGVAIEVRRALAATGYAQPHSMLLQAKELAPTFSDAECAEAFDATIEVCVEMNFPVDLGLALLIKKWHEKNYSDSSKLNQYGPQTRLRISPLSKDEVRKWIRNEKSHR